MIKLKKKEINNLLLIMNKKVVMLNLIFIILDNFISII